MILDQIETAYRNEFYARTDETKAIYYFSHEDFPGLEKKPLAIHSSKGHRLQGYSITIPIPSRTESSFSITVWAPAIAVI